MKPLRDVVYIRAERDKNSSRKLGDSGVEIFIDTVFQPSSTENACHDGEVVYTPSKLSNGFPVELEPGDHVYGSHNITSEDHEDDRAGEDLYRVNYRDSLYCKILADGKIHMLSDWNLIEPIFEPEENLYSKVVPDLQVKTKLDKLPNIGTMRHPSAGMQEMGLKDGDTIWFTNNSDYEMFVEGTLYYRMKDQDIAGTVVD